METAMTYVVNPFANFFKGLFNAIVKAGEIAGTSRAAAELHRQGYHEEAKALMLDLKSLREQEQFVAKIIAVALVTMIVATGASAKPARRGELVMWPYTQEEADWLYGRTK